jgi:hypothetical protein
MRTYYNTPCQEFGVFLWGEDDQEVQIVWARAYSPQPHVVNHPADGLM